MAKVTSVIKQESIITIELSEREAKLVKDLVQNDLTGGGGSTEQESIRLAIWNALDKAGVK